VLVGVCVGVSDVVGVFVGVRVGVADGQKLFPVVAVKQSTQPLYSATIGVTKPKLFEDVPVTTFTHPWN
jgi:hypothetical protein